MKEYHSIEEPSEGMYLFLYSIYLLAEIYRSIFAICVASVLCTQKGREKGTFFIPFQVSYI